MKLRLLNILMLCLAVGVILVWKSDQPVIGKTAEKTGVSIQNNSLQTEKDTSDELSAAPVFAAFDVWVKQYFNREFTNENEYNRVGEELAVKRREALRELVRHNPQAAVENAISAEKYNRLPAFITEHLEKRITANGDFFVRYFDEIDSTTGKMTGSHIEREVIIGKSAYKAVVYGRREVMTTKLDIPLQGFVIDDVMVVDESPVRQLNSSEIADRNIGLPSSDGTTSAAEIGGKIVSFFNQSELENFVREQIEWESKIGSVRPDAKNTENQLSPWTEGMKKILFIRVDFPDRPGVPIDSADNQPLTEARVLDLMNNQVNSFYVNGSYNKTSLQTTVTPVVRMPQPQSYYVQNSSTIGQQESDARNAARAAGFETNNFDLDIVGFSNTQVFSFAAIGCLGCKGLQVNGNFSAWLLDHELGHNYGLGHANSWRTTDGTIIGQGNHVEGGYPFDIMGGGTTLTSSLNHFNARYKRNLDWLTDADIQTITADGVYRIFAQDSINSSGIRALKIRKNAAKNYWVEFRQLFNNSQIFTTGAIISWDAPVGSRQEVELLDMTPNTPTANDAPLLVGQSFYDDVNRIKLTVIGKNNTVPESLDIKVEINVGCSFTLSETTQNISASGGDGTINVNTQSGCNAVSASGSEWLFGISSDETTNALHYTASANYSSQMRTGTITVAGQTFTVNQSPSLTSCVNSPSGLIAWWRGEGNELDETGTNNGALVNNILFGGGKIGGGFVSNVVQDGKIIIPDSISLAFSRSMTIEGWIKVNSVSSTGRKSIIVRKDNATENYIVFLTESGKLWFAFSNIANSGAGHGVESLQPLTTGVFYHFAATLDDASGQVKLFVNGSQVNFVTTSARPYADLDPAKNPRVEIGGSGFDGVIDELSVYNRPLSAAEIQAIYNAGTAAAGSIGKCLLRKTGVPFDFDGDGKSDISVFRPEGGAWYLLNSAAGFTASQFGISTDKIVPADYDGDGKTDLTVYRNGIWYLNRSSLGFTGVAFGDANDIPQPADFDGDGKAELAVWRPSNGVWYVYNLVNNQFTALQFGAGTDKPVVGDYDGDGKADYAVFRPSNGTWYLNRSTQGFTGMQFGDSLDKPVPADYDGDGKTDIAVYRPSNGVWYLQRSQLGFTGIQFGISTDLPVAADYDGDGKADIAVFRNGVWYLQQTTAGFTGIQFGAGTDKPTPNAFVP